MKTEAANQYMFGNFDEPTSDEVTNATIKRLIERHKMGMDTYGTTMKDNPEGALFWIDSAIEEALDLAQYLERLKADLPMVAEVDEDGNMTDENIIYFLMRGIEHVKFLCLKNAAGKRDKGELLMYIHSLNPSKLAKDLYNGD